MLQNVCNKGFKFGAHAKNLYLHLLDYFTATFSHIYLNSEHENLICFIKQIYKFLWNQNQPLSMKLDEVLGSNGINDKWHAALCCNYSIFNQTLTHSHVRL